MSAKKACLRHRLLSPPQGRDWPRAISNGFSRPTPYGLDLRPAGPRRAILLARPNPARVERFGTS